MATIELVVRIHIDSTYYTHLGLVVNFKSTLGSASAAWTGPAPKRSQYEVEINFDDHFIWGENMWSSSEAPSIKLLPNNGLSITAELLPYDNDGCAAIKLENSVILIDTSGMPKDPPKALRLEVAHISLYPVDT